MFGNPNLSRRCIESRARRRRRSAVGSHRRKVADDRATRVPGTHHSGSCRDSKHRGLTEARRRRSPPAQFNRSWVRQPPGLSRHQAPASPEGRGPGFMSPRSSDKGLFQASWGSERVSDAASHPQRRDWNYIDEVQGCRAARHHPLRPQPPPRRPDAPSHAEGRRQRRRPRDCCVAISPVRARSRCAVRARARGSW